MPGKKALAVIVSITAACATTALVASPASAGAAARVSYGIRVFDQNIDGNDNKGTWNAFEGRVDGLHPDVIMIEEICKNQVDSFKADPRYSSWSTIYTANIADTVALSKANPNFTPCTATSSGDTSKGEMLASPHPFTDPYVYQLANDDHDTYRNYHLTCANITVAGAATSALRACVTHLRSGHHADEPWLGEERTKQTAHIKEVLQRRIDAGTAVVWAGDVNDRPGDPELDSIYALANNGTYTGAGSFDESDQTDMSHFNNDPYKYPGTPCDEKKGHCRSGQFTEGPVGGDAVARYDDIFYSHAYVSDLEGGTYHDTGGSDHHPINSTATLSLLAG